MGKNHKNTMKFAIIGCTDNGSSNAEVMFCHDQLSEVLKVEKLLNKLDDTEEDEENMRQQTINVYTFEELSEEAQEHAIETRRQHKWEFNDIHWLEETFAELAEEQGFENVEFNWDLSCSQGSGVCFTGDLNVQKFCEKQGFHGLNHKYQIVLNEQIRITLNKTDHHYNHSNCVSVEWEEYYSDEVNEELAEELQQIINDVRKKVCAKCETTGHAEIEWQESDECIKEDLREFNEFESNGKII